jgi:FkbM family methyltransferase
MIAVDKLVLKHTLYEILIPMWSFRRGQTRWLNLVTQVLDIRAYGFLKQKRVGNYKLRLDPGDPNDLEYYFQRVGAGYSFLMKRLLRPGDCVIDVGANVGYFSAVCAQRVGFEGQVYAIEASPFLAERLRQCVAEVAGGPIRVYHSAVWRSSGVVSFNAASNSGWSSLRENATFETLATVQVPAITLDDFVLRENIQRVRVLKLDIEGAEIDALMGAEELLKSGIVDYILVEAEAYRLKVFGYTGQDLAYLLEQNGYRPVCMIENDAVIPLTEDQSIPGSSNCDYLYAQDKLYQSTVALLFKGR